MKPVHEDHPRDQEKVVSRDRLYLRLYVYWMVWEWSLWTSSLCVGGLYTEVLYCSLVDKVNGPIMVTYDR